MEKPIFKLSEQVSKRKADEPLDKLLSSLNEGRAEKGMGIIGYPRLNRMLQKLGKSKVNWDRNIFIGNVLDAKNPASYFWWIVKQEK